MTIDKRIFNIINNLDIPNEFGINSDDDYDTPYIIDYLAEQLERIEPAATVNHGVSKVVITLPDCNYVIKIPFSGTWTLEEYYDEETNTYEYGDEDIFEENKYANDIDAEGARDWDYCENELIKYNYAVENGFGDFFAETDFLAHIKDNYFYIQEKVTILSDERKQPSQKAKQIYLDNYDNFRRGAHLDSSWIENAIDYYGADAVLNFLIYLRDNDFEDLHNENIGYAEDGRPVLLDWAGWRG